MKQQKFAAASLITPYFALPANVQKGYDKLTTVASWLNLVIPTYRINARMGKKVPLWIKDFDEDPLYQGASICAKNILEQKKQH